MPHNAAKMAIIYDFDGTLAPGNLQENSFIPDVGMKPGDFWSEVESLAINNQCDRILMYMYLMLDKARAAKISVHPEDFRKRGLAVNFFNGVEDWFDRINRHGKARGVDIDHFVVSSGNSEIIEGTCIAHEFKRIYASKFFYDENGVACWPGLAINFTTKTQYLFRINKGAYDQSDDRKINEFVRMEDRPVPFENMIYIGDGETDVPCFRMVKDMGGLSIVVFPPRVRNARSKAGHFIRDGRVHCMAPADYSDGRELDHVVRSQIDLVSARNMRDIAVAIST